MFLYRAVNENGDYIEEVTYKDKKVLSKELMAEGYFLISYKHNKVKGYKRLKLKELYIFSTNMSLILFSGVEFIKALFLVKNSIENKNIQRIISKVEAELYKGKSPSKAMEETRVFPNFFTNIVKTGEISGGLDTSFKDLASYYKNKYEFRNKIINLLIYPLIILLFTIIGVILILKLVIPRFLEIYEDFQGELPRVTKFILGASSFLNRHSLLIFMAITFTVLGFCILKRRKKYKYKLDRLKFSLPIIGKIYENIKTYEATNILKILVTRNLEFYRSLEILYSMEENLYLKEVIDIGITSLELGNKFSDGISDRLGFSNIFKIFIELGEETGEIEEGINNSNEYLKNIIDNSLGRFEKLIEPVIMVIIGIVVGILVLGIITPMFSMIDFII